MKFEWDPNKRRSNKEKHGIDLEAARQLWIDKDRIEIQASFPGENRSILIARIENKLWTAIFTERGDAIRIISVRHARTKEAKLYEQKKIG
jgi:uncharacterized DUF497 family protein